LNGMNIQDSYMTDDEYNIYKCCPIIGIKT